MFFGFRLSLYVIMQAVNECAFHAMALKTWANRYAKSKVKAHRDSADAVSMSNEPKCSRPTATCKLLVHRVLGVHG